MPVFHCFETAITSEANEWTLGQEESHHLIKVLRARPDDTIFILNGKGLRLKGRLIGSNPKAAEVEILSKEQFSRATPKLGLAVGVPKPKTIETIIRQATEMGVCEIQLLNAERSEVPKNFFNSTEKLEKLRKIAKEACKQSENPFFPEIHMNQTLTNWLKSFEEPGTHWVAHPTRKSESSNDSINKSQSLHWLLVGPEGGLTEAEFQLAREKRFHRINLGQTVLRVETACVVICAQARMV
jgi:16S rRNA (uracil1498-N3)-methyltransferase